MALSLVCKGQPKQEGITVGIFQKASLSVVSIIATLCLMFFTLSALGADYQNGVSATVLKKSSVTGNGQKIIYPVTDKAEVTARTVNLAPGAETDWHSHPIPVYAYVVEGMLDVEIEVG